MRRWAGRTDRPAGCGQSAADRRRGAGVSPPARGRGAYRALLARHCHFARDHGAALGTRQHPPPSGLHGSRHQRREIPHAFVGLGPFWI